MTASHGHEHEHAHDPLPVSALRERGRRLTKQRAAIWDVLVAEPDAHLSADEVAERVQESLPGVNASTIYRTLDVLVDDGFVRRTDLGGDRAYYEPAHEHLHRHLVCEDCGTVSHVHDDVLADLGPRVRAETGFVLGEREITLFGLCVSCADA